MIARKEVGGCPAHVAVSDGAVADVSFVSKGANVGQVQPESQEHTLLFLIFDLIVAVAAVEDGVVVEEGDVARPEGKGRHWPRLFRR